MFQGMESASQTMTILPTPTAECRAERNNTKENSALLLLRVLQGAEFPVFFTHRKVDGQA